MNECLPLGMQSWLFRKLGRRDDGNSVHKEQGTGQERVVEVRNQEEQKRAQVCLQPPVNGK